MKKIFNKFDIIIIAILLGLFITITILIFNGKFDKIDEAVTSFILSIRNNKLTNIMSVITNISSAYSLIVITILLIIFTKKKRYSLIIAFNLLCSFLIGQLIKIIIKRPRPVEIGLVDTIGYSYPSGHSTVSMAFFGLIIYLIYKYIDKKLLKVLLIILNSIIIILICFSRIYLGVHYFSDVIGYYLFKCIH